MVALVALMVFTVAGCATTRAKKPDAATQAKNQVADLQGELGARDQQIQELQARVEAYERSAASSSFTTNVVSGSRAGKSPIIHVKGVSVADIQRALARAGLDPGPVDGKAGKKTKKAIRAFQRSHHLPVDGVIGSKTWAALNG